MRQVWGATLHGDYRVWTATRGSRVTVGIKGVYTACV
jgi:hypothetical protein